MPDDLAGKENEGSRQELAKYFVQRRRADISAYMDTKTVFPSKLSGEMTYKFSTKENAFFQKVLALIQESLTLSEGANDYTRQIFWWSALALLRAASSSPAASKATLQNRALGLDDDINDVALLDAEAKRIIFDQTLEDDANVTDTLLGSDHSSVKMEMPNDARSQLKKQYQELLVDVAKLEGLANDSKLKKLVEIVKKLLEDGFAPIIFCRFIHTAEYVGKILAETFPKVAVAAVTGQLPPEERENRVQELKKKTQRLLVCTDCLSEGINFQDAFNAVVHYDLSWNPTRHEQREGRVDRFGQPSAQVKVITLYGENNPIDGYILDVLLRKHEAIRKSLGILVPFPENSDHVMQAILKSVLLRKGTTNKKQVQQLLPGLQQLCEPERKQLEFEWDKLTAKEQKRSRTIFAQQAIKVEEVAKEVAASRIAGGDANTVANFLAQTVERLGGGMQKHDPAVTFYFDQHTRETHKRLDLPTELNVVYEEPAAADQELILRTHPFVENLANYVFETAMDPNMIPLASRCGVMRTDSVTIRTTIILCRFRFELVTSGKAINHTDLTEYCAVLAFSGAPEEAQWLSHEEAQQLLSATPKQNVAASTKTNFLSKVTSAIDLLLPHIKAESEQQAKQFLTAHRRVRDAAKLKGVKYSVTPKGEPDILGIYIYLPVLAKS